MSPKEENTTTFPSYEKKYRELVRDNSKIDNYYGSPPPALNTLGNPYSEIQFPNYSKDVASDFLNSKEKILTTN